MVSARQLACKDSEGNAPAVLVATNANTTDGFWQLNTLPELETPLNRVVSASALHEEGRGGGEGFTFEMCLSCMLCCTT